MTHARTRYTGRHRRARTIGAAAVVVALVGGLVFTLISSVTSAPTSEAMAKVKCKQTTGTAAVDPIVHHNEAVGSAHLHQFFGNNGFLSMKNANQANATNLSSAGTNCANPADKAGYWTPVLMNMSTGKMVPTLSFIAYYRSWDFKQTGQGVPLPYDARLIGKKFNWTCGQHESVAPQQSIPDCSMADGKPGSTLTAHVDFPSCWDGVKPAHRSTEVGDTSDNKHFAYRVGTTCPAGFPVKTVQLRETIMFAYTGKGNDVMLTSDHERGTTDGKSMHADFWNTWDPAGFATMVRNCVNLAVQPAGAICG